MGCKASKDSTVDTKGYSGLSTPTNKQKTNSSPKKSSPLKKRNNQNKESLYALLSENVSEILERQEPKADDSTPEVVGELWSNVVDFCTNFPVSASYVNNTTKRTPLHLASMLIDFSIVRTSGNETVVQLEDSLKSLITAYPDALSMKDNKGNIPIHYLIQNNNLSTPDSTSDEGGKRQQNEWTLRTKILGLYISCFDKNVKAVEEYFSRNDVIFHNSSNNNIETNGVSALYYSLQTIPDDFFAATATPEQSSSTTSVRNAVGITIPYIDLIIQVSSKQQEMCSIGNFVDGDKGLALLYRRFTRQFDLSEKFFDGDNSRPEVTNYRRKYKIAASNTWKLIELCLRPRKQQQRQGQEGEEMSWRVVHRAVQVETPPDLLRYIVETNSEELTQPDNDGNLPLHYGAMSVPPPATTNQSSHYPAYYTKYVIDELLYKFPEGSQIQNKQGKYPLELAIESNKQFIGGGIKSLYDAYPEAIKSINLDDHPTLQKAIASIEEQIDEDNGENNDDNDDDAGTGAGVVKDEQHDAIMLVQKENVDISEIVTSMWAYEEDAGVQMLGSVAITKIVSKLISSEGSSINNNNTPDILRMSLSSVAAVVNAMKAHPNEPIVQEKACLALKAMSYSDGKREVSFVALGAIAAIIGAMQAHVGDAVIQEVGCSAISTIIVQGSSSSNTSQGADRATIVASVSGLTAIVNSLAAHPDNVAVQKEGCLALKIITDYDKKDGANLPELPKSQTSPLLQHAIDNYPTECKSNADVVLSRLSP